VARQDRDEEARIDDLLQRSDAARLRADTDNALRLRREAIARSRALADRFPDDLRHERSIAATLYAIGAIALDGDRPDEAVEALDECETLYESLGSRDALAPLPFVCDVRARRGRALAAVGRGASAVADVDGAVRGYATLTAGVADDHPHHLALARVLTAAAVVQFRFGDPDLAVGAADTAIRGYLARADAINSSPDVTEHAGYMADAVVVAEQVHAAQGRDDLRAAAVELFRQLVPLAEHRRVVAARVRHPHAGLLAPGATLPSTLAEVLARHDRQELARETTRAAVDCAIRVPSERTSASTAHRVGTELARLVAVASAPADRLRVGLEAHWVLAAASEQQTHALRYGFDAVGDVWMRALLACAALLEETGDAAFALDVMSWAAGVAQQLTPHLFIDRAAANAVHDFHQQHARLLAAGGDVGGARQALRSARQISALLSDTDRS
jgi:tetratricopeptide (TPR) repeat protein